MENCTDYPAREAQECGDCFCATCRIVYAIYMVGKAIMQDRIEKNDVEVDEGQSSILKSWE